MVMSVGTLVRKSDDVFRSMRVRNYRLFFIGQLISVSGTAMQQVAQDWLVFEQGGRAVDIAITTTLQLLPVLLLGTWGGMLTDRTNKRRLLVITQAALGMVALSLSALALTDTVRLWNIYVLAALLGCVTAFDMPPRQAFVSELVGSALITNAVSLNNGVLNAARIIGPAIAGVMLGTVGLGFAFLINGLSYAAVIIGLIRMDCSALLTNAASSRTPATAGDGIRYVIASPALRSTMALMAIVAGFGLSLPVVLPLLAHTTFHEGSGLFAVLTAATATGSVVGAVATATRPRPTRVLLLSTGGMFAALMIGAGLVPNPVAAVFVLALLGMTVVGVQSMTNSFVQLHINARLRGRVLAVNGQIYRMALIVGSLLLGWLADRLNPQASLLIGGTASAAVVGLLVYSRVGVYNDPWSESNR
jgi:MFS family permease